MSVLSAPISSMRSRIISLSAAFAVVSCCAIIWLSETRTHELKQSQAYEALTSEAQKIALKIDEKLQHAADDARFIAFTPPIDGLIRSRRNNGVDPLDNSSEALWRNRLETIFRSLMEVRPSYAQIRYIEMRGTGKEIVRVNRSGGRLSPVAVENLQSKGEEPYMDLATRLRPGQIGFTPITLNRENGIIDPSRTAMFRTLIPVFDPSGTPFGIVIINVDAVEFFDLAVAELNPTYQTWVTDDFNNALHYDPVRKTTQLFLPDRPLPTLVQTVAQQTENGSVRAEHEGHMLVNYPLPAFGGVDGVNLNIVAHAPAATLLAGSNVGISESAVLAMLLLAIGVAAMAILAARMTRPLQDMAEAVARYGGDLDGAALQLPVNSKDEIGHLARTFSDLVAQLEDSRARHIDIIRHAVDGLIVIDDKGIVETFNPACEEMFGYRAHHVVGKNITMLMSHAYGTHHDEYLSNYRFTGNPTVIGRSRDVLGRKANGEEFSIEISVSEFKQAGKTYYSGIVRDMTAAKRAQQQIQYQKETLELALDGGELGLWDWNVLTGHVAFSEGWAGMVGYQKDELTEDFSTWERLVDAEDLVRTSAVLDQFIAGKIPRYEVDFRMQHKAGHWVWVQSKGKIFERNENGAATRIVGVHIDVTERKLRESDVVRQNSELEQANQTLEFALDSGELGLWRRNLETGEVDFCERSAQLVGLTRAEMSADHANWNNLVDPADRERVATAMNAYLSGKSDRFVEEFRMKHADGHWVWIQSKATIAQHDENGKPTEIVGIQFDVTSDKLNELRILERNRRLLMAESVANMGHWSLDSRTNEIRWSEGIFSIYGLDPENGEPALDDAINFYHPDDRDFVAEKVDAALTKDEPFEFQMRLLRPDGEIRHVISRGEVIMKDGDADQKMVFGVFQDVTDRVVFEESLTASREKTNAVLQNIVDGVVTVDRYGQIDDCNPAFAKLFGYSVQELNGMNIAELVPSASRDRHIAGMNRLDIEGDTDILGHTLELPALHKNGETFLAELTNSRIELKDEYFYTSVVRDVTERKRVETMKNEFVSTVNHELRTPLTSIFGSLDLLKHVSANQLDERGNRLLTLAHEGCSRLSSLVNDILDIEKIAAGKMEFRKEPLELTTLVDDIVGRHESLAERYKVSFDITHHDGDISVLLDPSRFNQALVNLLSNASKFSPESEKVEIHTRLVSPGLVRVSVVDHGPGIPEKFQARIFERFAQADGSSTRKNTAGTGLGLNITKSIIEAFDGDVTFETEEGKGTVFHFNLPLYQEDTGLSAAS